MQGAYYSPSNRPALSMRQVNIDVLSGLTVSLALVPEALAFAIVAGVAPLVGLYAAPVSYTHLTLPTICSV